MDWQIDGDNFFLGGGPKNFQESVGGQFKTWLGQHHDFLYDPKSCNPTALRLVAPVLLALYDFFMFVIRNRDSDD